MQYMKLIVLVLRRSSTQLTKNSLTVEEYINLPSYSFSFCENYGRPSFSMTRAPHDASSKNSSERLVSYTINFRKIYLREIAFTCVLRD